jgi:hypothetical protein
MKFAHILFISQLLVTPCRCVTLSLPMASLTKAKCLYTFEYVQKYLLFCILLDEVRSSMTFVPRQMLL